MNSFILSCESTVDMPFSIVNARNIPVLFYSYTAGGKEYEDDMERDPEALPNFYKLLQEEIPSTSQINEYQYIEFFTKGRRSSYRVWFGYDNICSGRRKGSSYAEEKIPRTQAYNNRLAVQLFGIWYAC